MAEGTKESLAGGAPGGGLAQALHKVNAGRGRGLPPVALCPPRGGRELYSHSPQPTARQGLCHGTSWMHGGGANRERGWDGWRELSAGR